MTRTLVPRGGIEPTTHKHDYMLVHPHQGATTTEDPYLVGTVITGPVGSPVIRATP